MARVPLPTPFRFLWLASAISNIGDGVRLAALPLLATSITTDLRLIAGVAVAERLPWLIFILPGGAWPDRVDRRRLRMALDGTRAVVMAALVLAIAVDRCRSSSSTPSPPCWHRPRRWSTARRWRWSRRRSARISWSGRPVCCQPPS